MIRISKEDLTRLVQESFEEGFREGIQKGRGFNGVEWADSHAKAALDKTISSAVAPPASPSRGFLKRDS